MGLSVNTSCFNTHAASYASVEIILDAPLDRVWTSVADIANWPAWNSQVAWISARIPLTPGARFEMRAFGQTVAGQVNLVDPSRQLVWSGRALAGGLVQGYTLQALDGKTHVTAEGTYKGLFPVLARQHAKRHLRGLLQRQLEDLRQSVGHWPALKLVA